MDECKIVFFVVCASLFICVPAFGQFPRRCTDKQSLTQRECCPVAVADGSKCGESSGRGFCSPLSSQLAKSIVNQVQQIE